MKPTNDVCLTALAILVLAFTDMNLNFRWCLCDRRPLWGSERRVTCHVTNH